MNWSTGCWRRPLRPARGRVQSGRCSYAAGGDFRREQPGGPGPIHALSRDRIARRATSAHALSRISPQGQFGPRQRRTAGPRAGTHWPVAEMPRRSHGRRLPGQPLPPGRVDVPSHWPTDRNRRLADSSSDCSNRMPGNKRGTLPDQRVRKFAPQTSFSRRNRRDCKQVPHKALPGLPQDTPT